MTKRELILHFLDAWMRWAFMTGALVFYYWSTS